MASASANIGPMDNSLKLTLTNIIDSYFEKDEADFNILNESNIDSLYYGIDDLHKCDLIKRNHNICSMHLNICSLPDKFDKLKLLLSQLDNVNVNIDFILICETYLTESNHDLFHLPGYNFISRHRKQTKCGGVGMYISDKYNYITRDDISLFVEHSFESIVVEVLVNHTVRQLYYTMVQPYLTYGIVIWGSTYQSYLKRTVILQKKAIMYMHKAHYNAHTKPLFYASNVLNIEYTYLLEVAKCMHDFTRRKLPIPLLNFFSSNLTVHQHNTRQVLDPHFTIIFNSIAEKSIIHRGPRIWSNIPQPIKECANKNSFNKLLKRHFLMNQE